MDLFVLAAVLFAAACHAIWNASIKGTLDPLATTVLIAVGAALVALPGIPFAGWPDPACWPWLKLSRKTSTPASKSARIVALDELAGPKVATIFALRSRRMPFLPLAWRWRS